MSKSEASSMPKPFRRLAWSNLSAQFSEQVALAAAPLAAVLLLGATAADTGFLQAAQTLPFLLLSLPAGVLADRTSRRGLMVGSEMLRAASLLAILMLLLWGHLDLTLLGALGALGAIGTVVYSVAAPALIPTLVPRHQLGDANRWLELARSSAFVAGPTVGGAVVGWTGASSAYVLAVGLSVTAVMFLSGLPKEARSQHVKRNPFVELREGAAFVIGHTLLRPILITAVFFNLSWFVIQGVFVAYAVHHLGLTAAEVGATFGTYGAGMLAGAVMT
jgi:MFS family permease